MNSSLGKTKVLITVMTYPHPSESHDELICTAGITENYEWVRLYPISYRYLEQEQKFKKYQWVSIELTDHGHKNDNRKESRTPNMDSIQILGESLSTRNNWEERRLIMDEVPHHTLNELKQLHKTDKTSLGIVKPSNVIDIEVAKVDEKWKPKWDTLFKQMRLFGPPPKPLKKIPYKFTYVFECADSNKVHRAMITDWELGVLFLKEEDRLGSAERAAESVKNKFLLEICSKKNDTKFFMGTTFPFNTWVVIGTFYPKKDLQKRLF